MAPGALSGRASGRALGGWLLAGLIFALLVVVLVRALSSDVPAMSSLGPAAGIKIAADISGSSDVDTSDQQTYRYGVLRDTWRESVSAMVRREVGFLLAHGWHSARAVTTSYPQNRESVDHTVAVGTPGSIVFIEQGSDIHASLVGVAAKSAANDPGQLACCQSARMVRSAVKRDEALISVTMHRR